MMLSLSSALFFLLFLTLFHPHRTQQIYSDDGQSYCYGHSGTSTLGYSCNGPQTSCSSYLIFRSQSGYQTPVQISRLLNSDPSRIAEINNIDSETSTLPVGNGVVVPTRCSCSGEFYQHNATYTIQHGDFYYRLANVTYEDLTTCQALIDQNPFAPENLPVGAKILVPLRCACPTRNQLSSGVKYLLTYVINLGDTVGSIAHKFGTSPELLQDANPLSSDILYHSSTVLVPLEAEPGKAETKPPSPPLESPEVTTIGSEDGSDNRWLFVGIGTAVGFLAPCAMLLVWLLHSGHLSLGNCRVIGAFGGDNLDDSDASDGRSAMSSESFLDEMSRAAVSLSMQRSGGSRILRAWAVGLDRPERGSEDKSESLAQVSIDRREGGRRRGRAARLVICSLESRQWIGGGKRNVAQVSINRREGGRRWERAAGLAISSPEFRQWIGCRQRNGEDRSWSHVATGAACGFVSKHR